MKKDHGRKETPERNFMDCWTTEHTHRVETHQHNLCSLISCQLESGNNHHCSSVVDRVNESLTWQKKVTRDLIGQQCEITRRLKWDQEKKKKVWENTDRVRDSCPSKRCGEQTVQQCKEMTWGEGNSTRNPCAGVDVSREEHGTRRHRECVDSADGDGVVVAGGWCCKDVLWWGVGCQEYE